MIINIQNEYKIIPYWYNIINFLQSQKQLFRPPPPHLWIMIISNYLSFCVCIVSSSTLLTASASRVQELLPLSLSTFLRIFFWNHLLATSQLFHEHASKRLIICKVDDPYHFHQIDQFCKSCQDEEVQQCYCPE